MANEECSIPLLHDEMVSRVSIVNRVSNDKQVLISCVHPFVQLANRDRCQVIACECHLACEYLWESGHPYSPRTKEAKGKIFTAPKLFNIFKSIHFFQRDLGT